MNRKIQSFLSEIFGFRSFRPFQEDIVRSILDGRDVFAVMPTGGGKSLCYQLPARIMEGVCVVVSPLISLMKDQVDGANSNGLNAGAYNSMSSAAEKTEMESALRRGEMDLLYISPERFNSDFFIERLKATKIAFFAVDEAHCISEWGHDFRPDYLALSRIIEEFPRIPLAAFTATATPKVSVDIIQRLRLRNPHLVRASFDRPNLFYRVEMKDNPDRQLFGFLEKHRGESGIIYRTSRKKVEETTEKLRLNRWNAFSYHAGMSDKDRNEVQRLFSREEDVIVVATVAFGMGIDKSNVRFVVHGDLPKNIEGYYQETGRAGRDGEDAECVLFFGRQDIVLLSRFLEEIEDSEARNAARTQLQSMIRFADHESCRRSMLLEYFGETYSRDNCGGCDICTGNVKREDATIPAQKVLSAIARTGERFGAAHVADILVGADTEKIRQFQHDRLPTYGVGQDQPKYYWRSVITALLTQNILFAEDPMRPILKLTPQAWSILRKETTFRMIRRESKEKKLKSKVLLFNSSPGSEGFLQQRSYSNALFEVLRGVRMEIAKSRNVPPYVIFSDRTLHELARFFPRTLPEFLQISGIGQKKADSYGERFLLAINGFCSNNPEVVQELKNYEQARDCEMIEEEDALYTGKAPSVGASKIDTLKKFQEGKTIQEIAEERGLKLNTILSHIEDLVECGYETDLREQDHFLPGRLEEIARWFQEGWNTSERSGDPGAKWFLGPAVAASKGEMDYDEAKLARIFLKRKEENQ